MKLHRASLTRLALSIVTVATLLAVGAMRQSFAQCGGGASPSEATNSGTEFLLCFEQNYDVQRFLDDDGYLEIYLASEDLASDVTITCRAYPTLNRVFHLAPRSSAVYRITDDTVQYHGTGRQIDTLSNLWITSSGLPDDRVVHVSATSPIVCYGMNHKVNTTDAFLALPRQTAGLDYRIMSYPNSSLHDAGEAMPSQFAVAAFSDGTDVTITPSAPTASGQPAGVPFHVLLNAGECVQIQTNARQLGPDLTGTVVTSNVPVAVFGSHARAEVPVGFYRTDGQTSRDHLTEQLPPVTTWGAKFIADAIDLQSDGTKGIYGDLIRVLALHGGTTVTINGQQWKTLAANGFADTLIRDATIIESSGPVLVALFAHTSGANTDRGDPFMAIVPPLDESYNDYTFFASEDPAFTLHKVIIVTNTKTLLPAHPDSSSIIFDNRSALPSAFFTELPETIGGEHYAVTELGIGAGEHSLRTAYPAEQAFTILAYGIGLVDSYGYTAGMLLKPMHSIVAMDDGSQLPGIIRIHNALNQTVYPDSMVVVMDHPEAQQFGVHPVESIYDIDKMPMGAERTIHLTSDVPLTASVSGTLYFYSHSAPWGDFQPSALRFRMVPTAGVEANTSASGVDIQLAPNPVTTQALLRITLPRLSDISIRIVDALGRTVRTITDGTSVASARVPIYRDGLPAGYYAVEVRSSDLQLVKRVPFIVAQ